MKTVKYRMIVWTHLVQIINIKFKNSVPASQRTQYVFITKTSQLMPFREIMPFGATIIRNMATAECIVLEC